MRKIAFYVDNAKYNKIDCRFLDNGNPGMGGTPYLIILIATELAKRNNGLGITLFVNGDGVFCEELKIEHTKDCLTAIEKADDNLFDFIVVNSMYIDWDSFRFDAIKNKLKIIPWCHNFNKYSWNNVFSKENKIARYITVSREQLDLLRDHTVFSKGDYIFNSVPYCKDIINSNPLPLLKDRDHSVVYMGSLLWGKSFHVLASLWPKILKKVPDANLYVIGSGYLYNRNAVMGKFGLAPESYEKVFMKYLTTSDGSLLPSVHFLGDLGLEKYDILRNSKVAVPNPMGTGETFCISAVEMQLMGCNVVSMQAPGYYDTIYNGTLVKSVQELEYAIVEQLNADTTKKEYQQTLDYINNNFSLEIVIQDWEKLLRGNMREHIHKIEPIVNPKYRMKYLKEKIRKSRFGILMKCMPSIDFYYNLIFRINDKIEKIKYGNF